MRKKNNQNFVQIPHAELFRIIKYLGERAGIDVIEQEESYTSKASFLEKDDIPVYRKDDTETYTFSGKRVHRGLYRSKNGIWINADLNGSANILRKKFPNAFAKDPDFNDIIIIKHPDLALI